MFITENVKTPVVTADMLYESAVEANEKYHALSMQMIKIEHTCIMNEDSSMLHEAEGKFLDNVKKIAKVVLDNFMRFLERVRAEWSKVTARFVTIVNSGALKYAKNNLTGVKEVTLTSGVNVKDFANIEKKVREYIGTLERDDNNKVTGGGNALNKDLFDALNKKTMNAELKVKVSSADLQAAVAFVDGRKNLIKDLEAWRRIAIKKFKEDTTKEDRKASDGLAISRFSRAVSKCVVLINKCTVDAFKVINAAVKQDKASKKETK